MVRIGFGMRLLAGLIDGVIMAVVGFALNFVILKTLGLNTAGVMIAGLAAGLAGLAYSSLEVFRAASLGKIILKMQIKNADGSDASQKTLATRWAIKQTPTILSIVAAVTTLSLFSYVGGLVGLAIFVGCFLALKPEKQAYHDQLLGTAVYGPSTMTIGIPVELKPAP